jgi:hypothetical protein
MLKEVVLGLVGPFELFPVVMLDSSCFCRSWIPEATIGEVDNDVGRGKLGPRGGHGGLSAWMLVTKAKIVTIQKENIIAS